RLARPPESGSEIRSDERDRAEERGDAKLAIGAELGRDAIRLGLFVVRPVELAQHPRRQARRDERARASDRGSTGGGAEERGRVLASGQVLTADVPVHEEIAA